MVIAGTYAGPRRGAGVRRARRAAAGAAGRGLCRAARPTRGCSATARRTSSRRPIRSASAPALHLKDLRIALAEAEAAGARPRRHAAVRRLGARSSSRLRRRGRLERRPLRPRRDEPSSRSPARASSGARSASIPTACGHNACCSASLVLAPRLAAARADVRVDLRCRRACRATASSCTPTDATGALVGAASTVADADGGYRIPTAQLAGAAFPLQVRSIRASTPARRGAAPGPWCRPTGRLGARAAVDALCAEPAGSRPPTACGSAPGGAVTGSSGGSIDRLVVHAAERRRRHGRRSRRTPARCSPP